MLNLAHYLDETAARYPDAVAAKLDNATLNYAELAQGAHRVANLLRERGVKPGDRVAMMIPNTPHFPLIYYGILHAGAVVVPVNVLFTRSEITHYLTDSEAVAFFAFTAFAGETGPAYQDVETCQNLFYVPPAPGGEIPEDGEDFYACIAGVDTEKRTAQTMPDAAAVILYTSGTTGQPKGAELTHSNMFFNAYYTSHAILKLKPGDICMVALPLFHSFGQTCMMNAGILGGATLCMLPRFEPRKALEMITHDKITCMALVPTMYALLLNASKREQYDVSSVRTAVSGGAALPGEVHHRFQERYGITILEGYGLSETSPVASFTVEGEELRVGSIGKPIWGVEMGVKGEDGQFLGEDEIGEIVIRGHNIMKGYINRPEATKEAIVEGWFHSGDMGKRDSDGYYYIVDRKKDLIIRGGLNIYPREIEEVIYGHPKVAEAAVIGVPDKLRGEYVKAYVAPRPDETLSKDEIRSYIQERMANYKWPREIEIRESLPKGPTGKLLKRALRDEIKG